MNKREESNSVTRIQEVSGASDKQFYVVAQDHRRSIQVALENRTLFYMEKQHFCIKSFFENTENSVRSQIWIAVSVYVIISIIRKRRYIEKSLHSILQIFYRY